MASTQSPDSTHPYTCQSCLVAFKSSELQRGHMQSDWHRYNLKRRVASLPPLSSDIFTEKVLANQATAAATAAKAQFEKVCPACSKTYFSENAFRNHLGSVKHKQRVAALQKNGEDTDAGKDDETNSMMSSALSLGEPIDTKSTVTEDSLAEQEFSEVVDGIKKTNVKDASPVRKRPTRPHHSSSQDRPEHRLSRTDDEALGPEEAANTDEHDPAVLQRCLFCNTQSDNLDSSITHMRTKHGLFIPEQRYLTDLEGLIRWLHDRVIALHECLSCGTTKHTTSGIQTHMRDKGHCMIAFESEEQMLEVGQFYDFRSSYSDDEMDSDEEMDEVTASQGSRLGAARKAQTVDVNGDSTMTNGDDEEWEDEEEDSDDTEDGGTALNGGARPKKEKKTKSTPAYYDEGGLHLPNGRTAGHRSLAKYYRQNLTSYPTSEERASRRPIADTAATEDGEAMDGDGASTNGTNGTLTPTGPQRRPQNAVVSRANGGLGMLGVSERKREEVAKMERKEQNQARRQESRWKWGNEKRNNFQAHFRDQMLQ